LNFLITYKVKLGPLKFYQFISISIVHFKAQREFKSTFHKSPLKTIELIAKRVFIGSIELGIIQPILFNND